MGKLVLNKPAIREMLKSAEIQEALGSHAQNIASKYGSTNYEVMVGRNRAYANIYVRDDDDDNGIMRAAGK